MQKASRKKHQLFDLRRGDTKLEERITRLIRSSGTKANKQGGTSVSICLDASIG